jgi:gluconate kinase
MSSEMILNISMSNSREYAKFKRMFVGPVLTRKQRIALAPPMPLTDKEKAEYLNSDYSKFSPEKKARIVAYVSARKKKRDKSMPLWANKAAIEMIYLQARMLTLQTGIKHEVDHIIPSNHELVCGLHVENNLQILTEVENILKSNSFTQD